MKPEFLRCVKAPLYWVVLGTGLSIRAILAYLDRLYRSDVFWMLAEDFWNRIGSVTSGFLVLLVLIRLFSVDQETGTAPVIQSTAQGRGHLFRDRLLAGCAAAVLGSALLAVGNFILSLFWGGWLPMPESLAGIYLRFSAIAAVGTAGYFLMAACVCDLLKNQPAAMCVCGAPFATSFFINIRAIKEFDWAWFFRYGFFTELMRGRVIDSAPMFWAVWYPLLLGGVLLLVIHMRKERKEL